MDFDFDGLRRVRRNLEVKREPRERPLLAERRPAFGEPIVDARQRVVRRVRDVERRGKGR